MDPRFEWQDSIDDIAVRDASLADFLRPMRFLSDLLAWWKESGRDIDEVAFIAQDEFTIDVVLPWAQERWLVLDCT
jgi:hypothetical protein